MVLRHLDFLDMILVGMKPIRFQQHDNRLYIDMDWSNDLAVNEFLVIECYRKLDPNTFTDVYNDMFLKRYATALIKKQWGNNMKKFAGVQLPGGVTLNGEIIYQEAIEEIRQNETEIQSSFELPVDMFVG
jgi:hypothetical protein